MPASRAASSRTIGAEDVGLDELARRLDRAVDVRLGREVDERVAALDRPADGVGVGDVAFDQLAALDALRGSPRRPA